MTQYLVCIILCILSLFSSLVAQGDDPLTIVQPPVQPCWFAPFNDEPSKCGDRNPLSVVIDTCGFEYFTHFPDTATAMHGESCQSALCYTAGPRMVTRLMTDTTHPIYRKYKSLETRMYAYVFTSSEMYIPNDKFDLIEQFEELPGVGEGMVDTVDVTEHFPDIFAISPDVSVMLTELQEHHPYRVMVELILTRGPGGVGKRITERPMFVFDEYKNYDSMARLTQFYSTTILFPYLECAPLFTSVKEQPQSDKVTRVYPNPSQSVFTVEATTPIK